ncbi:HU family DNA-binding protein [Paludisphaera soli]|uniref:HU family DNA-binding protein n=1 Tax=Paludisphaera soli TaxID=2712865 RepID=UPI0013EAF4C7|nr:HU family DNA-binding protein [Paludisphaera soli]
MAKKAAPKAAEAKAAPAPAAKTAAKAATKTEIFTAIAAKTNLSKKDVAGVFEAMSELIEKEIGKKGPGLFVIPGLLKIKVQHKPATKARPGFNPATKEQITIKAKPARKVVKVLPLKALKDLI